MSRTAAETLLKNLSRHSAVAARERERQLLLLAEYAACVAPDILCAIEKEDGSASAGALNMRPSPGFDREKTPAALRPLLARMAEADDAAGNAAFCLFLADEVRRTDKPFAPWQRKRDTCRLRYMPSARTEKAYLLLLAARPDVLVAYARNAQDAVSDVDTGRADFCLLPKEDENGTPALYMDRLAEKYDLMPAALVRFVPEGEEAPVLFGVYGKAGYPFCCAERMQTEVRLSGGETLPVILARLTEAAGLFGFGVMQLSCRTTSYGRLCARMTLSEEGDRIALWLYLSLFCEEWSGFAVYPVLGDGERGIQ